MQAPFNGPVAVVLEDGMDEFRVLMEENRSLLEAQLGGPFHFDTAASGDGELRVRLRGDMGRLVHDSAARRLIVEGPEMDDIYDAVSLLFDLWRRPDRTLIVEDCRTPTEAAERIAETIESTWPSFALHDVDWSALCQGWMHRVEEADDPIAVMREWVAQLGDPHTAVRPLEPPGRLPYRAELVEGSLVLIEVPKGTAGEAAGAQVGDTLEVHGLAELVAQHAVRPHSRSLLIGLAALRGPNGQETEVRTRQGAAWTETFDRVPWPEPFEIRRLADGATYLRLRVWLTDFEDRLHAALDEIGAHGDVVLDLRGNGGGNFMMATRARGRFLDRARRVGWIRYRHPAGGLTEREPIKAAVGDEPRRTGALMVLIDPETYSASEDFLMGLAEQPDVRVVGAPSGGGSGRPRSVRLLSGWQLTISTCHTFTNDGVIIEGRGHPVAGPVPRTLT